MDKRTFLAAFLTGIVVGTLAWSNPRGSISVQQTYRNEGNSITPFNVSCSSTAWTAVVTPPTGAASRVVQRSVFIQNLAADNSYNVCISTSQGAATCGKATTGSELAPGSNMTGYGEATFYCRARSPSTGETLKGIASYDSAD